MIPFEAMRMTEKEAREYLEKIRWPHGLICPYCQSKGVIRLETNRSGRHKRREGLLKCRDCREQFTVTVGTVLERTHIPLAKWVAAFSLMCSSKKGISALQLHRMLQITYKCAWHMCHRIRWAMVQEPLGSMLKGDVEIDETYVGGKPRKGDGQIHKRGRGTKKIPVVALIQRNGDVRTKIVPTVSAGNLRDFLTSNIDPQSRVFTDELNIYKSLGRPFASHHSVNHSNNEYARIIDDGIAHINTCEGFFSLLKRGINGAFHHVSSKHLFRYCDEFSFRWNRRRITDIERTAIAVHGIIGKRLPYKEPITTEDPLGVLKG